MTQSINLHPIGIVRSPHLQQEGTPIQPALAHGAEGTLEIDEPYVAALGNLAGFERIWVLCFFDRARAFQPRIVPYRDHVLRGLFATRAPARPNPIGLSCLRLIRIEGHIVHVSDIDILDGTPILDLKPYVPEFDAYPDAKAGWLDESKSERKRADDRFEG